MSAPIKHAVFLKDADPAIVTATLWRGAMIDRYARADLFVTRLVQRLRDNGFPADPKSLSGSSGLRIGFLTQTLEQQPKSPHVIAALASLGDLSRRWPLRNALAHGVIRTRNAQVQIEWIPADSAPQRSQTRCLSATEMLRELAGIDALQRRLGSQLGQFGTLSPPSLEENA